MSLLPRIFKILITLLRYRLDTLLPSKLPLPLRLLFNLFPNRIHNRGEQLRRACEELGPIFVKFGQLLSTRPDLIPPDIVTELNALQDNVAPFSVETFRKKVETSLNEPIEKIFKNFDDKPLGSASVAQVHAATLLDGREVVVKVIRPGIVDTIEQDIKLLLIIAKCVARFLEDGKRLKPVEIVDDYRITIFDELNLQREAANASQLRRNFEDSSLLYIPEIYWEYCAQEVMVTERIYGIPITNIEQLKAQHTDMKMLAERGVEIFFTQVFEQNFFHADMHPGNIFVSKLHPEKPKYIAIDMAIVGSLAREDQYYLARNMLAMFRRNYRQVAELHVQSGWVPKDTKIGEFEAAVRTVCEPIFEKPLAEISFGKVLINLFATARRFNMEVQPQLVLLQKTLLNIEGLGRQLYPELDLWKTAHPFLERWLKNRFHPKTLFNEFKYHAPEWMEKFPDLPMKIYNNIDKLEALSTLTPTIEKAAVEFEQKQAKKQHTWRRWVPAVISSGAFIACLLPQWNASISDISFLTVGLGVLSLALWRRV